MQATRRALCCRTCGNDYRSLCSWQARHTGSCWSGDGTRGLLVTPSNPLGDYGETSPSQASEHRLSIEGNFFGDFSMRLRVGSRQDILTIR